MYKLLESWHNTLRDYEMQWSQRWKKPRAEDNFLPYVYGETAQVGILAVAADRVGGLSFMEFCQDKRSEKRSQYTGRQDLEIAFPHNQVWTIEADFWEGGHANLTESRVNKLMTNAAKDVKKIIPAGKRMALVFLRPYDYDNGAEGQVILADFQTLVHSISVKKDFAALHICQQDILIKSEHRDSPGILILGCYVRSRAHPE